MSPAFAFSALPLPASVDWLALVAGLAARPGFWWLDSALARAPLGRFSFAGAEPFCALRIRGERIELETARAPWPLGAARGARDVFAALRGLLPPRGAAPVSADAAAPPLPFVGGLVAALGYELGARVLRVPEARDAAALPFPDALALGVDRLYALDHQDGRAFAVALCGGENACAAARAARAAARELAASAPFAAWRAPRAVAGEPPDLRRGFDASAHAKAVDEILARIAAGDLYQACLTHRIEADFAGDAFAYYGALRAANPAPFGAFLALPEGAIACSSPECFLRCDANGELETRPIKGTRPRCAEPRADRAQAARLRASEKDRAENLMIVDLARNDLGRVSELGSVHVPELFAVESYAAVHQLVSTVRGRLARGRDALDAVRAAFPPGSMTGAPKIAAMRLLAELERARRGLYAGALGYLDARGGCDLAVVIRTAFLAGGRLAVHTGGGIVADSDARAEWAEAESKASALLAPLAGRGARISAERASRVVA
ncbi:MAG TPA: aminodeoxychorismate synthase component I [Myxococcota bacterium]|nr:aminodeoxychorismate synthase component I [Myxococcota bacterium]